MCTPWKFGPETRRLNDPKRKWPRIIPTLFKGKDDENFMGKTAYISRYTTLATGFFSMWDIVLMPHKGGIPTALARIKWWALPFIGGGITYTATVGTVAGLRGKSDHYNHLFGGFAVGAVLGKHSKSIQMGIVMGALLGFLAMVCKDSAMYNYELFPPLPKYKKQGNQMLYKHDYTLQKDRPGYWVRSEEEVPKMLERGQI